MHGRVFRKIDGEWTPLGELLTEWPHVPARPADAMAVWVLPRDLGCAAGDVVVLGELAHRLLVANPPEDPAWGEVISGALALHDSRDVRDWIEGIELWTGMRLSGDWQA